MIKLKLNHDLSHKKNLALDNRDMIKKYFYMSNLFSNSSGTLIQLLSEPFGGEICFT